MDIFPFLHSPFFWILILVGAAIFFAKLYLIRSTGVIEKLPYKKRPYLMNSAERVFFEKIKKLVTNDYEILPQILMSNIVAVDAIREEFWFYQNKINKKTIDFVIFKKPYYQPIVAIEYDGKTHEKASRRERDEFVNQILQDCGISIVRVKHKSNLDVEEILKEIQILLD